MKASSNDIAWYNNFYKEKQSDFPSWYVFIIEELKNDIEADYKLLEVGCGQAKALQFLVKDRFIAEENVFAIDQSNIAIGHARLKLPKATINQGDIYNIEHEDGFFDIVLMAEVIEHLECPAQALSEINRVLKENGKLFISFPNYYNFPWLVARILAEKLNKPSWIALQPVDKIYSTSNVIKFCKSHGFKYRKCIGTNYFPPFLYKIEHPKITKLLNFFHLDQLSFHPVLIFEKNTFPANLCRR